MPPNITVPLPKTSREPAHSGLPRRAALACGLGLYVLLSLAACSDRDIGVGQRGQPASPAGANGHEERSVEQLEGHESRAERERGAVVRLAVDGLTHLAADRDSSQEIGRTQTPVEAQPQLVERALAEKSNRRSDVATEPASIPPQPAERAAPGARHLFMADPMTAKVAPHQHATTVPRLPTMPVDRENYQHFDDNPVKLVLEHPVSTFSIDVDTGAYANIRRFINAGRLPPKDAVRTEELINYFDYAYRAPVERERPFAVTTTLTEAPWHAGRHLLRVAIQGYELDAQTMPSANLVFLVDVSGSMQTPDKLPLLKSGLKLLVRQLRATDRISLVVYAGGTGVALPPTAGDRHGTIEQALDALRAGGRTNGAAGIELAYQMARQGFIPGGINRVLLATDGDFNVGTTNLEALKDLVSRQRESGISLTTLGFGTGNYNEALMEQMADIGNGNHAYVDSLKEANKVLVQQMSGTLATIAKDVKIQIEFNPAEVSEYRLIGYENRALQREDFDNDTVDAGEIGAGHDVTALYELTLAHSSARHVPALRYAPVPRPEGHSGELAYLRIRYKAPSGSQSRLLEWPLRREALERDLTGADADFRFAAAVAGFGQLLRGGKYLARFSYDDVLALARSGRGDDPFGYRGEFVQLVSLARTLAGQAKAPLASDLHTAER